MIILYILLTIIAIYSVSIHLSDAAKSIINILWGIQYKYIISELKSILGIERGSNQGMDRLNKTTRVLFYSSYDPIIGISMTSIR